MSALQGILAGHGDEGEALRAWLRGLASTFLAYGADLAHELCGGDNVAQAERALLALEAAKLIERGAHKTLDHRRTQEIAFFGVGGQRGEDSNSPVLYGFAPGPRLAEELEMVRAECEERAATRAGLLEERAQRAAAESAATKAARPSRTTRPQINLAPRPRRSRPYACWRRLRRDLWRLEQPGWGYSPDTLILQWTDHAGWCWSWRGAGRAIGHVGIAQAMRRAVDHLREYVAEQVDALRRIGVTLHPDP